MAPNQDTPNSPYETSQKIEAYTPSNESDATLSEFSRYDLRRMHGQDPEEMPHKFTPKAVSQRMLWPSNEEAYAWAEAAMKDARKRQLSELKVSEKKLKTPGVAAGGSSSTPETDENLQPQQAAPPPAPVPFSMPSQ